MVVVLMEDNKSCERCRNHQGCSLQEHLVDYAFKEGNLHFGTTNWEKLYTIIGKNCGIYKEID